MKDDGCSVRLQADRLVRLKPDTTGQRLLWSG
jgi:hypothetical protein